VRNGWERSRRYPATNRFCFPNGVRRRGHHLENLLLAFPSQELPVWAAGVPHAPVLARVALAGQHVAGLALELGFPPAGLRFD